MDGDWSKGTVNGGSDVIQMTDFCGSKCGTCAVGRGMERGMLGAGGLGGRKV